MKCHIDDGVTLWVEGDDADVGPVARITRPAPWVAFARLQVGLVTCGQDRPIRTGVALCGRDITDAAVAMFEVVPVSEVSRGRSSCR